MIPVLASALLGWSTVGTAQAPPDARRATPESLTLRAGRFTIAASPADRTLAEELLRQAAARDTFPGLPRPREAISLVVARDRARFRQLIGPRVPEWGSAIAVPAQRLIVMQGGAAGSDAGDPREVLRHELAHLALHEAMGDLPPRWFDEGYASFAAGEWSREEALATNLALAFRGAPSFDGLEDAFYGGSGQAQQAYALAFRAVADLAALDPQRGLSAFFAAWKRTGSMDAAVREAYGITLAGFEKRWQQRTRRRFGVLAIMAEVGAAFGVLGLLVMPFYLARRKRDRERMAALVAADRRAEAEEAALAALLGEPTPADRTGEPGGDGAGRAPPA